MSTIQTIAFPSHDTDPRKKSEADFILQFGKAIWANWHSSMPDGSIFYAKRNKYAEIRDYAINRQSLDRYKKQLLSDESQDASYMKIDMTPRADGMVLRNIAVAKLQKSGYNIVATPINASATDAEDKEYARIKTKIMLREELQKRGSELADSAELKPEVGEPEDLEELEMRMEFGPKLTRAMDIEESVQMIFYETETDKILDAVAEDNVDFGVSIVKEGLDENNKVTVRKVYPGSFGCSYTEQPDFSDITWGFEVIPVKLSDLSKTFNEDQMAIIRSHAEGRYGNPSTMGTSSVETNGYDLFKTEVLDFEFISYNKRVTEETTDKNGNIRISKASPKKEGKNTSKNSYTSKTIEALYKGKWVIGTEYIYDYGLAENQKRTVEVKTMSKTKLSYHIQAASFHNMRSVGLTEQMIPIIDDINIANYKLRNFRNRLVPNGFDIDLAAIEGVALGKGGQAMKPIDVLDMFFETGILISRRSGISMDKNVNYKAINAISNNMADHIVQIIQDINQSKQALREISGLNELTDGSTPNARTLTTIAQMANESTNNALWYMLNSRRKLIESLARGVTQRLKTAIKNGPYDGYNKSTGRHIRVPESIAHYDYDIMVEDRPGDEQRQMVMQLMLEDIRAGYISHSEVINILYTNNLKRSAMLLAYKVEKGKQRIQNEAMAREQANSQMQAQINEQAEMLKHEMAEEQHQREMEKIGYEKAWDFITVSQKQGLANEAVMQKATGMIAQQEQDVPGQQVETEEAL